MEEEVRKLSVILSKDATAFKNWRFIYDNLNLPAAEAVILSTRYKNGTIKSYELFREIIQCWKDVNGNRATPRELESILRDLRFTAAADIICEQFELKLEPVANNLKLNYEGVVANYVSRHDLETEIIKFLIDRKKRLCPIDFPIVVLHGIGGVGKTTLARRICQLTTDFNEMESEMKYFEQNRIWIHAEKIEQIIEDFSKIPGFGVKNNKHSDKENLDKFYNNQLNNRPCLVVFDNVDNYEMITNYLPLNLQTKVSVLITSNVKCDFGDLGNVKNIEIGYFTVSEFPIFVREILPSISDNEIYFLHKYTERIPYLANIACRGLAKWRRHHPKENIEKYFEDNDDEILDGANKLGLSFQKYTINPQEIVQRQINLMQKHDGKDGELAYKLLCRLAYYNLDFSKEWLLNYKVESDAASISILCDQGFLKYITSFYADLSIHRSYQKAVRNILQQNKKEEEQIANNLEIAREYKSYGFNWGLLWESGYKYGDSLVEKMVNHKDIISCFKGWNEDKNSLIHLIEYFKRTKSPEDYIQLVLIKTDDKISPLIECKGFHKVIDNEEFSNLICETKSYSGWKRKDSVENLFCELAVKKQKWLELFDKKLGNVFKYELNRSLFLWAARENELKAVEYLIGKGFNDYIQNIIHGFCPPLYWAVNNSNLKIAEALLKAGVNPNIRGLFGTPLHLAVSSVNVEMVKLLLSHNADPNIKDSYVKTALKFAKEYQRNSIVAVLEEYNKPSQDGCRKVVKQLYGHNKVTGYFVCRIRLPRQIL